MNIYAPKKPSKINSVSVTLTIAGLVLGYFLWAFIPIYWPIFQLKGICRAACNDAYRIVDNEEVLERLVMDSRRTGLALSESNFRISRIPYTEDEILAQVSKVSDQAQRSRRSDYLRSRGKTCVIEYMYRGEYPLPLIGQSIELTFTDDVRGSLETVTW